jgi:mono/diheme cytochrome c family protein
MHLKWFAMPMASCVLVSLLSAQTGQPKQAGDAAKGKAVFAQCAVCHDPASDARKVGPGLKGMFKRAKMSNGKPMNEPNVRAVLDSGGNGMPPYRQMLTAAEKDNLIAYLRTL